MSTPNNKPGSYHSLVGSFKIEITAVFLVLAVLIILPLVSVVAIADTGSSAVSGALAAVNPVSKLVEIFDPNGNKVTELELSTVWPTRGYVSDEFGTFEPFRHQTGPHTGIDIANAYGIAGDPVTPFTKGTVLRVEHTDNSLCGKYVKVDHGHNVTSVYCHLDSAIAVEGAEVEPGDIIGNMGNTGFSTGVHLHFGIHVYGLPVNPRTFMVGEPEATGGQTP